MTATITHLPRRVSPSTRQTITTQAALVAAYPLDETNPHLDAAVRQVSVALAADLGHTPNRDEVLDCFWSLVDVTQRLNDLETDSDEYLASLRLPRTGVQYDITRGELLADIQHWTQRLLDVR